MRIAREAMVSGWRKDLGVIPARYRKAHARDFNKAFLAKLFAWDGSGLILWGPVGVGKTHAMAAVLRSLIVSGNSCKRVNYEMLCLQIRDTFKAHSKLSEMDVIRPLLDCDYLLIEDLGSGRSIGQAETDFSLRTFLIVLDQRIEHGKTTMITTNKSVENLSSSFDERVASRLKTFTVLKMAGRDKRERNNNAKLQQSPTDGQFYPSSPIDVHAKRHGDR